MKTIFLQKGTIIKVINGCPFGSGNELIEGEKEIVIDKDLKGNYKEVREIVKALVNKQFGTPKGTTWLINTQLSNYILKED